MQLNSNIDYGPLAKIVGTWAGSKGIDLAPEEGGEEKNHYFEEWVVSPIGLVTNAEEQNLAAVHYRQKVNRLSDDKKIHDQTGYWLWDANTNTVINCFTIPRGVSVLAGGEAETNAVSFEVKAGNGDANWPITQSPFMMSKAKTLSFSQTLNISENTLSYHQITVVDIYGKVFNHSDENLLKRS